MDLTGLTVHNVMGITCTSIFSGVRAVSRDCIISHNLAFVMFSEGRGFEFQDARSKFLYKVITQYPLVNHICYLGKSVWVANETKALGISKHLGEILLLSSIQNRTWI